MTDLTSLERNLLTWLGESEYSQYGECCGRPLDSLIEMGLVQVHSGREFQSGFIAQGDGAEYQAVSLTEAGRIALAKEKQK
jgi:hypothetical protein